MKRFLLVSIITCLILPAYSQGFDIVRNGKPVAVLDEVSHDSVNRVADIFNYNLKEITGTVLKKEGRKGGNHISFNIISPAELVRGEKVSPESEMVNDAFRISNIHGFLSFNATSVRGLENAVYRFFEKYGNVRCYTHDALVFLKTTTLSVPYTFDWFESPAFSFRVPYYYEATFANYINWNCLNSELKTDNNPDWPVSRQWGLWVHTLHRLLPPEVWFDKHPEYYALRSGVRTTDQVCLSNPEVLEIVYENLKKEIAANPKAKYWSVSQMDNYNFCECDKCRKTDSIEGSHSGTMLRFVNELARRIPDKVISTLAYQYTRSAPSITLPLPNVNIMLCTIECDRSKPIAHDTGPGSFYNDLQSWSALTNNILIWDYVINFSHLLVPFPNFSVLAENLKMFRDAGVTMMFEQGLRGCSGGEMNELRTWLLAKLMWNPDQDTDSLINEFVHGYYGETAAPYILEYISKAESELHRSCKALTLYEPPATHASGYLSPENLREYFRLLNAAKSASANNPIAVHRIDMAMQSIRYAWLEVSKSLPFTDDWLFTKDNRTLKNENIVMLDELTGTATEFGPALFHETRLSPEEYRLIMGDYFKNGVVEHKAVNKSITYSELPDTKYTANGMGSLVDGVRGTGAYQVLWQGWWGKDCEVIIDLGNVQQVSKVVVGYLDENQSWIMGPESVEVFSSDDGTTFTKVTEKPNPKGGLKSAAYTDRITAEFNQITSRYVKVKVNNFGKLPVWRGVDADSWLFVDEIEVY